MRSLTAWRASLVGFAVSITLLVGIAWITFNRIVELNAANAALQHTLLVRSEADGILSLLKDAETGQRGFVITGTPEYLEPYDAAMAALPPRLNAFRMLTADNATQQDNATMLGSLIDRKMAELGEVIAIRQRDGFAPAAARIHAGLGKRVMDAARDIVGSILSEEERLLASRQRAQRRQTRSVIIASIGGFGLALVLLVVATVFMARAVADRERAKADRLAALAVTDAVQKSEEHLRVTIASIGDAIVSTDGGGRVTRMNAVAESLTGWRQAEALGKPLSEIFVIVNEHTRSGVENPVEKVLRDGQIAGLANHTVLIARNGLEVPIDDSAAPIRSAGGDVIGVVLVFRDITPRRNSERELKLARERTTQFLATVPCVLWETWGEPGADSQRVDFVSSYVETMLGYSPAEWLAAPNFWLSIVHPDDRAAAARAAADAYSRGVAHTNRFRWVAKDGRTLEVETRADVIKDDDGAPIGMRGVTIAVG